MEEDPKLLIRQVLNGIEKLLLERFGTITSEQRRVLEQMKGAATQFELLVTYADDTASANARRFLSYETRETLATVLGYAEMLLDGLYGPVNEDQKQQVNAVRANGKMLLVWLDELLTAVE
jgi:hypothetical protein